MDKLREQIARKLWDMSSCMSMESCEIITDAILALLQPRMLSKDEATSIYELITCGGVMDGGNFVNTALAKLKLIQEEA